MTPREEQVLALVRADPLISQAELAARLGISRSAVAGHIMNLTAKGVIRGRGYVVADEPFVVVIGGANVDICGAPKSALAMRDSNPGQITLSPGGVARNVAENLARLGIDARLITAVGADNHGDLLMDLGRAAGIDMSRVMVLDQRRTSTYVSILDDGGDMLVAVNDMAIADELVPARIAPHAELCRQAALVIADTNLPEETLAWLGSELAGNTLIIDTVSVAKAGRVREHLAAVTMLKAGMAEAEALAGRRCRTERQLAAAADWFHEAGVEAVVVTLGARGVYYSDSRSRGRRPATGTASRPLNANGAGDAFVAGLACGRLRGLDLAASVRLAQAAAGIAMAHEQTISPAMSIEALERYGTTADA